MGNSCWKGLAGGGSGDGGDGASAREARDDTRRGKLNVIFRYFDADGDGVWCFEEVAAWARVVKGEELGAAGYEALCRRLRAGPGGLRPVHVDAAYGVGTRVLDAHFAKLVGLGVDLTRAATRLLLMPGMRVRMHSLARDYILNNTCGAVISVLPKQDAALIRTDRGPVVIPLGNLAHAGPSDPGAPSKPRRVLIVVQTSEGAGARSHGLGSAAEQAAGVVQEALVSRGWGGQACAWTVLARPRISKHEILQALQDEAHAAANCTLFVALLTDPGAEWCPADAASVGPLRAEEVYERLVLACPRGADVVLLETGVHGTPLLSLPYATDARGEAWVCLENGDGRRPHVVGCVEEEAEAAAVAVAADRLDDGYVPPTLWVTSRERVDLAGRYTRCEPCDYVNGWPVWESNVRRIYSDRSGYWKVCATGDEMRRGVGGMKSKERHPTRGELVRAMGDRLPGFVAEWSYTLHGVWAGAAGTTVTAAPPRVVSLSGSGASVLATARMFAYAAGASSTLHDLALHARKKLAAAAMTSMHAPDLRAEELPFSDVPAAPPTPEGSPQLRLASRSGVSAADPYEEGRQVRAHPLNRQSMQRGRTASTDGLAFLCEGSPAPFGEAAAAAVSGDECEEATQQAEMSRAEADKALLDILRNSMSPIFRTDEAARGVGGAGGVATGDPFSPLAPTFASGSAMRPPVFAHERDAKVIFTPTLSDILDSPPTGATDGPSPLAEGARIVGADDDVEDDVPAEAEAEAEAEADPCARSAESASLLGVTSVHRPAAIAAAVAAAAAAGGASMDGSTRLGQRESKRSILSRSTAARDRTVTPPHPRRVKALCGENRTLSAEVTDVLESRIRAAAKLVEANDTLEEVIGSLYASEQSLASRSQQQHPHVQQGGFAAPSSSLLTRSQWPPVSQQPPPYRF